MTTATREYVYEQALCVRLRQLRERAGWSQQRVEQATGISRCYLSRVENGALVPRVGRMHTLATLYGASMQELVA